MFSSSIAQLHRHPGKSKLNCHVKIPRGDIRVEIPPFYMLQPTVGEHVSYSQCDEERGSKERRQSGYLHACLSPAGSHHASLC